MNDNEWMNTWMVWRHVPYNYPCSQVDVDKVGYKIEAPFPFQVFLMELITLLELEEIILSYFIPSHTNVPWVPYNYGGSQSHLRFENYVVFKKIKNNFFWGGERSALSVSLPINVILFLLFPSYFSMQWASLHLRVHEMKASVEGERWLSANLIRRLPSQHLMMSAIVVGDAYTGSR